MRTLKVSHQNLKKIVLEAIKEIKKGNIVVCPTDTVYGLITDAAKKKAVEKIFKIKKRERTKPLPVFIKDIKDARKFAHITKSQEKFLKKNWPGKITIILKAKRGLTEAVYKNGTIALRSPDYRLIIEILKIFKKPLAQTSANISGKPASTKIKEVLKQFKKNKIKPDLIIDDGNLKLSKPSKIIDLTKNKIKILRR